MMELDFCLSYKLQMFPPDCHLSLILSQRTFFFFDEVKFVSASFYGLWILCHT